MMAVIKMENINTGYKMNAPIRCLFSDNTWASCQTSAGGEGNPVQAHQRAVAHPVIVKGVAHYPPTEYGPTGTLACAVQFV